MKVIVVLWGNNVDVSFRSTALDFYQSLVAANGLPLFLREYNTTTPAQRIGPGTANTIVQITPLNTNGILADGGHNTQVADELIKQINAGVLPAPDANTVYMVHFPPGIQIDTPFGNVCDSTPGATAICGYHWAGTATGVSSSLALTYAVIPDYTNCLVNAPGTMTPLCLPPGSPTNEADITYHASRRLMGMITDPQPVFDPPFFENVGWCQNNSFGGATATEIGDICDRVTANFASIGGFGNYLVQQGWSDALGRCTPYVATVAPPVPATSGRHVAWLAALFGLVGTLVVARRRRNRQESIS